MKTFFLLAAVLLTVPTAQAQMGPTYAFTIARKYCYWTQMGRPAEDALRAAAIDSMHWKSEIIADGEYAFKAIAGEMIRQCPAQAKLLTEQMR